MIKRSMGFVCLFAMILFMASSQAGSARLARTGVSAGDRGGIFPSPGTILSLPKVAAPGDASRLKAKMDFGRLPLYFIANDGQVGGDVAFYVQGKDKALYFTPQGITMVLGSGKSLPRRVDVFSEGEMTPIAPPDSGLKFRVTSENFLSDQRERISSSDSETAGRWAVKLDFVGANPDARPVGLEKTGAVVSYFKGKPEDWKTGLATYSRIIYRDLWPGIDLIYSGTFDQLKYEFIVHPGADPSQIRLAYRGAESVDLDDAGRLHVATPAGSFFDDVPSAYQEIDGGRRSVRLAFKLGDGANDSGPSSENRAPALPGDCRYVYGFEVGDYDPSLPLVLDPAIVIFCGYIGGSGSDGSYGVAVDPSGNIYIAGDTQSTEATFPEAVGPDVTHNGGSDAFVAKLNPAGTALIYCGYIGGAADDYGNDLAVDGAGAVYVTGVTKSSEASFPVLVGPDLTFAGGLYDAYIAKINPAGTSLVYCGYIGGTGDDETFGVAVDNSGNAYVPGFTDSTETSFPVAVGPDVTHNGNYDGFIAKINAAGSGFVYCGYIGGSAYDALSAAAVDASGAVYLAGSTTSTEATFPVAVGPDLTHNGGYDAFVAKLNSSGTALIYCGYVGGSDSDSGYGVRFDVAGRACICGQTKSTQSTFPVAGGPDLTHNGDRDAYVAQVKPDGSGLVFCGYIGGSGADYGRDVAVDNSGNIYVSGYTTSTEASFPVVIGPDTTHNGLNDVFVAKVLPGGSGLGFCGYIGGAGDDWTVSIALDQGGNIFIAGSTYSTETTFPVAVGPDLTHNGGMDAFVAKIVEEPAWKPRHAVGDFDGDGADEVAVDFGSAGIYLYNGGTWTQLSSANPESLVAAQVDGDPADEILADLGASGLWLWNGGVWAQLSGVNVEGMAAGDVDADGADEIVGDFGTVGMWLNNGGIWTQLSGVNADYIACANLDGGGGEEIVGDFGATGLWIWNAGAWAQLSGVNADYVAFGNTNGVGGEELIGDFGSTGLWLWSQGSGWLQLSGVNADYMITGDIDANGDDELIGDFAATGLWQWDSGVWTQLSGVNAEFMIRADIDGNGDAEVIGDFGPIGLWLVNGGVWTQLSGVNAEYMMAGDVDGDNADEILADFGSLGLWLWNGGAWSKISALNPE